MTTACQNRAEAERLIQAATNDLERGDTEEARVEAALAQTHALLAIVDWLRRIEHELTQIRP